MKIDLTKRELKALMSAINDVVVDSDWCLDEHLDSAFEKLKEAGERDDE
ncbi:hypothetical protein ACLEEJ_00340 [Lonsdalea quercina]